MEQSKQLLHGIQHDLDGWQVWSHCLQYPVHCGSPADAKRIAKALELKHPYGAPVDYAEVDVAIAALGHPNFEYSVHAVKT